MHLTNTLFTLSPCHGSCPFVKYINTYPSDSISSRRLVKRINISHKIAGTTQIGPQKTALVFIPGYVPYSIPDIFSCRHEKLFSTVWTPIQYVTLHFRDRSSIEITIVMCDREALYIRYCFRAGVKAIQHGVNITSVCFILQGYADTNMAVTNKGAGQGRESEARGRGPEQGGGGWGPGTGGFPWLPVQWAQPSATFKENKTRKEHKEHPSLLLKSDNLNFTDSTEQWYYYTTA